MLLGNHGTMSTLGGTTVDRFERERREMERQKAALNFSHSHADGLDAPQLTHATGTTTDRASTFPIRKEPAGSEEVPSTNLRRAETRYSLGPEKMWSIGADDLDGDQDGHVEKSVAKALSKAEPNNRSRKTSHTLGFFREALPEEKAKKKDTKATSHTRDRPATRSQTLSSGKDVIFEEQGPAAESVLDGVTAKAINGSEAAAFCPAEQAPLSNASKFIEGMKPPANPQGDTHDQKLNGSPPGDQPSMGDVNMKLRLPGETEAGEPEPEDSTPPPTPPTQKASLNHRHGKTSTERGTSLLSDGPMAIDEPEHVAPRDPLEAIELIPYKHQVGGHTTIWRFSKRAVCKQLNNRENEFYETVERYHRDLLSFLPRYIGVLNITSAGPTRDGYADEELGATMVNKKLRNEVFNDAFLKQPVAVQKHRRPHRRPPVPRPSGVPNHPPLRPANSDSRLASLERQGVALETEGIASDQPPAPFPAPAGSNLRFELGQPCEMEGVISRSLKDEVKDVTGTSAPEPETMVDKVMSQKRKRRYSGAASVGSHRGTKPLAIPDTSGLVGPRPNDFEFVQSPTALQAAEHEPGFKIPRPINPKEAQTQRDSRVEYFLLLEDLTAGMKRPCIMDLKMGTRQYGGRRLKAGAEFQEALTRFLYNGLDYYSILKHIPTILRKLDELQRIVRGLRGYRFYAASLLMFYDGDTSSEASDYDTGIDDSTTDAATDAEDAPVFRRRKKNKREVDFKIADFANSITAASDVQDRPCPPQFPEDPDGGFLRGLSTLKTYFLKIQRDTRAELGIEPLARGSKLEEMSLDDEDEGFVSE
ncbi:unnamed protein product [Parascedosporium putredinis]|uniref:Kinase n=1 Tax=Parascedosporium putredinis TaxID=1442378 RepID=A0A9P1MC11_9PEZI|nr:unnamed protein product [Parascedosporium putredinis]CAI7999746.1 unnamed protein product [Parascedosporium putredinis]